MDRSRRLPACGPRRSHTRREPRRCRTCGSRPGRSCALCSRASPSPAWCGGRAPVPGGWSRPRRVKALAHKPAYLIAGTDWPKIDTAAARLRSQFDDDSVEQITVGDEEQVDIVAACNALGLFGGERLVLVRGAEALSEEQISGIVAYLADPAPGTCLALFGGKGIAQDGPLAEAVDSVGDV